MIRFAGVELLMPSDKLEAFVSRFIPPRREAIFGDFTRSDGWNRQRWNWPEPPPLTLNSLYWPTGATRWSQGLFLADYAAKQQIVEAVTDSGRVVSYQSAMLELSEGDYSGETFLDANRGGWKRDQNGRVLLGAKMFLLPPRPVTVVTGYESETVWLIPLVDDRYFWRDRATNSSFEDNPSGTLSMEPWYTAEVTGGTLENLAGFLNIADDFQFPSQIDPEWGNSTGTGVLKPSEPAAPLLDLAATNLGRRIVRDFDGDVMIQSPQEATSRLDSDTGKWARVAGAKDHFPAGIVSVPKGILVRFLELDGQGVSGSASQLFSDLLPDGGDHDADGPILPEALSREGDFAVFRTSGWRLKASGHPDQTMTDFVKTIARYFYAWRAKQYDICFAGVKEWPISGFDDAVEITLGRDAILTRVWTVPPESELRIWIDDPAESGGKGSENFYEGFLTADLAAPALGTDPPESATVKIYRRTGDGGELVETEEEVEVHSSDPFLTGTIGTYCQFMRTRDLGDEVTIPHLYVFTYVSCGNALGEG